MPLTSTAWSELSNFWVLLRVMALRLFLSFCGMKTLEPRLVRLRSPEDWFVRLDRHDEWALICSFDGQFISGGENATSLLFPKTRLRPDA
jgi:hypothetical protein